MGNLNSDLAVSSAGINPDDESNSIISEEDSAFEDQTPAAKMKKNQVEPSFSNN